MSRPFSLTLGVADIETIIETLEAAQEHSLSARVKRQLETEQRARAGQEEAAAEMAAIRADRAANAILTQRQAECLAAIRAGKGPYYKLERLSRLGRSPAVRWRHVRSMGGAVKRMVGDLIDEGLLTERRELSDGGRARLAAWEQKHGAIGEVE